MKTCKSCRQKFEPVRPLQSVCGFECAIQHSQTLKERTDKIESRIARLERKAAKEKAKGRGQWLRESQAAFNAYIRARDADLPCVSCGRFHQGQWHAGHYMATSIRPSLRFHELNVWKQCAPCNDHLHGNLIFYRAELIRRIGVEKVEWLEGEHPPAHYSIDDLKEIKSKYSKLAKEIVAHGNK